MLCFEYFCTYYLKFAAKVQKNLQICKFFLKNFAFFIKKE